ncbi:MAG: hypothetical protein AB7H66_14705 [Hyphomonadaceae bacterium]
MKFLRPPLAIATAALIAAPPAVAQPMQLTPQPQAPAQTQAAPPAPPPAATPETAPAQSEQPTELRGPSGPLPSALDLALVAPPSPPPPPPAPSPPAAPPAPPPAAPPPPPRMAAAPSATVTVGAQTDFTRLAFRFAGPTTVTPLLQGSRLDLRFSRAADIDIAELRATPPRFVREVRRVSAAGAPVRLQITLEPGVRQRHFVDGDRVVIDLLPPEEGAPQTTAANGEPAHAPAPARPPVNGTGRVQLVEGANDTRVTVTWPAPARAAAFRRGEAIWLVFDATGRMDISGVTRVGRRHQDVQVVQGQGVLGLRIPAPPDMQVSANADDNSWTFTLAARATAPQAAPLTREVSTEGRGRMTIGFGREGVVRWINDPEIGDRIAVAMIGGPAHGVITRRATVEAAVLPSAHGGVVEPRADDLAVSFNAGTLTVTRGDGLIASAPARSELEAGLSAAMMEDELGGAPMHAQAENDLEQVREHIDGLMRRAAEEGVREGAAVDARMALARYLLEHEFAAEALGALRIVAINQGELVEIDPEYRLLRGAANVMMGRVHAAQLDLTASALMNNPSAALWRGYSAAQQQNWPEARRELERGAGALEEHPPSWRARFQLALAQAATELNDFAAAEAAARAALANAPDQALRLQARHIEARIVGARGDAARALTMFDELSRTHDEETAVRAEVEAIRIRRATGVMRAIDSVEPLEALRFRWRGNSTELAIVGLLGETYSEMGRWRDALATMRIAADRFPTDPAARQLRVDMSTLFERLFLDGDADRLEPIQALGLFYEFSDLTPVGPNGDRIVRLLAGRLVHVDLLEQAAQLLQHQVDERLEGVGKAQVAADLAAIYLMDHKPDRALVALASSRQPSMPQTLQADRRILEARALLDLGRLEGAAELVERDRSEDAQRVRVEAAWRGRDWQRASAELRTLLGMRNRSQPLDGHGRQAVLRAGVALTLAGDEAGVRALYRDYAGDMANTPEADAFEIVAAGINADGAAIRDVARAVARTDLLDRFLTRLRTRMTEQAAQAAAQPNTTTPSTPGAPPSPLPPPPPQAALPPQRENHDAGA